MSELIDLSIQNVSTYEFEHFGFFVMSLVLTIWKSCKQLITIWTPPSAFIAENVRNSFLCACC